MITSITRADHLAWCKTRALTQLAGGDMAEAYASFASDMRKHPETATHSALGLGVILMMSGALETPESMRDFILGFH